MEKLLTQELLHYLLAHDFTVLFAAGQGHLESCTFLPIQVDVADFLKTVTMVDYSADKYLLITEALELPEESLMMHHVIL